MFDYRLSIITPPSVEPVTLAEQKLWSKIDGNDDDAIVTSLIEDARAQTEICTDRTMLATSIEIWLNCWPGAKFSLPRPNLISVTSVKYYDESEALQTLSTDSYAVLAPAGDRAEKGQIALKPGQAWPDLGATEWPIRIIYVAGYGTSADDVPEGIKSALKSFVSSMYAIRDSEGTCGPMFKSETFERKLDGYRTW